MPTNSYTGPRLLPFCHIKSTCYSKQRPTYLQWVTADISFEKPTIQRVTDACLEIFFRLILLYIIMFFSTIFVSTMVATILFLTIFSVDCRIWGCLIIFDVFHRLEQLCGYLAYKLWQWSMQTERTNGYHYPINAQISLKIEICADTNVALRRAKFH